MMIELSENTCLDLWRFVKLKLGQLFSMDYREVQESGEGLSKFLIPEAAILGITLHPIEWSTRDYTDRYGQNFGQDETYWKLVRDDSITTRKHWLEDAERQFRDGMVERGEIPHGWKGDLLRLPRRTLQTEESFFQWIRDAIDCRIHCGVALEECQTIFHDAHRWMFTHDIKGRPDWPESVPTTEDGCVAALTKILAFMAPQTGAPTATVDDATPLESAITARPKVDSKEVVLRGILHQHHFTDDGDPIDAEPLKIDAIVAKVRNGSATTPDGWSKSSVTRLLQAIFGDSGHAAYREISANNSPGLLRKLQDNPPLLTTDGNETVSYFSSEMKR